VNVTVATGAARQAGDPPHDHDGLRKFAEISSTVEALLARLWAAPAVPRERHGTIPNKPAVYLFSERGKPVYVGQTRKLANRLRYHTRPRAQQEQASFAFLLAKADAKARGIIASGTRKEIAAHPEVLPLFVAAKERVARMDVRWVEIADAHTRTVFEVYAALALGTGEFNSFDTH
jgi:hypothetical protein